MSKTLQINLGRDTSPFQNNMKSLILQWEQRFTREKKSRQLLIFSGVDAPENSPLRSDCATNPRAPSQTVQASVSLMLIRTLIGQQQHGLQCVALMHQSQLYWALSGSGMNKVCESHLGALCCLFSPADDSSKGCNLWKMYLQLPRAFK